jgi:formyl-CoA transferase
MLLEMDVVVDDQPETVTFPGVVPKLEQLPGRVEWLGPELGQHTVEVLTDLLKMTDEEITKLRERKVV